jgi:hypothetical protein
MCCFSSWSVMAEPPNEIWGNSDATRDGPWPPPPAPLPWLARRSREIFPRSREEFRGS